LIAALHDIDAAAPLVADSDLAWRAFACALLAEALGED
jgi:hypothetical protein